jgi:hypothetical protein
MGLFLPPSAALRAAKASLPPNRAAGVSLIVLALSSSLAACTTYRDQLVRSQQSFEQNQHERTLALLQALELNMFQLQTPEQAQYAYLRGMTDYRMGYRSDARHWLSIAKAYDDSSPGMLPADWKARMTEALDEMNGVVYNEGLATLAASKKPGDDTTPSTPVAAPKKK